MPVGRTEGSYVRECPEGSECLFVTMNPGNYPIIHLTSVITQNIP